LPKVFDERLATLAASATGVGGWVFMVFAIAAVAQVVVGYLLDRYPLKRVYAGVALLQAPLVAAAAVAAEAEMLIVAVAMMLSVFGLIPIHDTIVARYTTNEWRSRIYGIKFVLALGVAALAVPLVAGLHALTGGFYWVFVTLAGFAAIVGVCALAMPGTKRAPSPASALSD
ncbi:MAG: MFS transporter, partial [Alphaproteobacteria bacterium]|nr:MFS transporter [Alphaproteobacteria bacterium]